VWPIATQCRVLKVSRAAFYKFDRTVISQTQTKQASIVAEIKRIHALPKHDNYGSPRMHKELNRVGISCSENTVAKLMQREGIHAKVAAKFKPQTTDSNHDLPIAPNRLNQAFHAQRLNQIWLTDFTYIHHKEGLSYLCTFQDLCSRKIVGWAVGESIDAALAVKAFDQTIALRNPKAGLIVHSDRGSKFASLLFHQCLPSMSRKRNCYDNAPMESFFKSFKTEEVYQACYQSHEQAVHGVVDYIDRFYNATRLHSALGYLSPIEFEQKLCSQSTGLSDKTPCTTTGINATIASSDETESSSAGKQLDKG
jgi:putative transposase